MPSLADMFPFRERSKYELASSIADTDDSEQDAAGLISSERILIHSPPRRNLVSILTAVGLVLAVATCSALMGVWCGRRFGLDDLCTRHTSMYSPIMDKVKMRYHEVRFDGRFLEPNVFRGEPPSPEVDKAWESLGVGYRPVMIPDDEAYRSGLTTNHTRRNSKYGGGYPVYVEGLHQLHCLNLVRKSLYYNYEHYLAKGKGPFSDPGETLHWHVSHCVDFIRQRLMCDVDIGVFGSIWVDRADPQPFVDFNTRHVCRDFEAVRAWAERHQVDDDSDGLPEDYWEPIGEGTYVWDMAP